MGLSLRLLLLACLPGSEHVTKESLPESGECSPILLCFHGVAMKGGFGFLRSPPGSHPPVLAKGASNNESVRWKVKGP